MSSHNFSSDEYGLPRGSFTTRPVVSFFTMIIPAFLEPTLLLFFATFLVAMVIILYSTHSWTARATDRPRDSGIEIGHVRSPLVCLAGGIIRPEGKQPRPRHHTLLS